MSPERLDRDAWIEAGLTGAGARRRRGRRRRPAGARARASRAAASTGTSARATSCWPRVLERWERVHSDEVLLAAEAIADPRERLRGAVRPRRRQAAVDLRARCSTPPSASRSSRATLERSAARRLEVLARACREARDDAGRGPPPRAALLRRVRRARAAERRAAASAMSARERARVRAPPGRRRSSREGPLRRPLRCAPVSAAEPEQTLAERLLAGDRRALARAITLVESDDPRGWELVREVYPHTGKAAIVGLTGAPGAGKSTLIGALTKLRRAQGRSVAVLSIDPSSPFTHGALLGDRIRLTDHFLDPGVFIRSMANRGALGGLSEAALQAALLMDAAGREDVFLETVGVGQAEVDIIDHADTDRARADARLRRLDPGAEGRDHGDPGHHRRQQGRPPADRDDGPRDPRRAVARAGDGRLAGADRQDRGACAARASPSSSSSSTSTARHIEAQGTLSERRRRNLRSEVLSICTLPPAPPARGARWPRTPRFQELLDEVVARRLDPASAATEILERFDAPSSAQRGPHGERRRGSGRARERARRRSRAGAREQPDAERDADQRERERRPRTAPQRPGARAPPRSGSATTSGSPGHAAPRAMAAANDRRQRRGRADRASRSAATSTSTCSGNARASRSRRERQSSHSVTRRQHEQRRVEQHADLRVDADRRARAAGGPRRPPASPSPSAHPGRVEAL